MNLAAKFFTKHPKLAVYPTDDNDLLWRPDLGFGYLRSNGYDYGKDYWEHYVDLAETKIGYDLTEFRTSFVVRYLGSNQSTTVDFTDVCDVGIGSGQFVSRVGCFGYDVNPYARAWLEERQLYADPYTRNFKTHTMWDVLEHVDDPSGLLRCEHVFTSVPVHETVESCLTSKHLKPNEHIWHFTHDGINRFMHIFGYKCRGISDGETKLGREAIRTYYFRRVRPPINFSCGC